MDKTENKTENEEITEFDDVLADYYSHEHPEDDPETEYEPEQSDNEEINNSFLSSGSNVQGIARLNLAVPLVIGIILIIYGAGQTDDMGAAAALIICTGLIVIGFGLSSYFKLKAFGEMAEANKICAYYLEKISQQLDEVQGKNKK